MITLLIWIFCTACTAFMLTRMETRMPFTPRVWWLAFAATLLVLLPLPDSQMAIAPVFNYVLESQPVLHNLTGVTSDLASLDEKWSTGVLGLIALVSLFRLALLVNNYWKLKQLVASGIPYQSENNRYPTFLIPMASSAFTVGLFRPIVALPNYFLTLPESQQEIIVQHEATHIRHKDHIATILWKCAAEMFWFNPFIRILSKGYSKSIEIRCDNSTISERRLCPKDYAATLLTCLKLNNESHKTYMGIGFNGNGNSYKDHKQRIECILSRSNLSNKYLPVAITASVIMSLSLNIASAEFNEHDQDFVYPVVNPSVSSVFGHIAKIRNNKPHHGIDFRGAIGTPVLASATGKVLIADNSTLSKGYGLTVVIQHAGKTQTLYAHLDESAVKAGQAVSQGEIIGYMGKSGRVTGPHLHFEMSVNSERVDPTNLLQRAKPLSL